MSRRVVPLGSDWVDVEDARTGVIPLGDDWVSVDEEPVRTNRKPVDWGDLDAYERAASGNIDWGDLGSMEEDTPRKKKTLLVTS